MSFVDRPEIAPRPARIRAIAIVSLLVCLLAPGCGPSRSTDQSSKSAEKKPKTSAVPRAALNIGDPAPPLQIDQWVVGQPVDQELTDGDVHVVEFWATWCGPCRAGMPHISELQQQHGDDVTFVGVTREDALTVRQFLVAKSPDGQKWGDVIKYRLATDARGATNAAYMEAAKQPGIPTAFIVGRTGLIEWIGHPAQIDGPLRKVVDDNWDRQAAIKAKDQQQRLKALAPSLNKWVASKQWDSVFTELDGIEAETGNSADLMFVRLSVLQLAGREQEAIPLRERLVEFAWDDAATLNAIAWNMASSGPSNGLDTALRAAERASELRNDEDPGVFDTIARVHFARRDLDEAIRWQRRAVENAEGRNNYEKTLEEYLTKRAVSGADAPASVESAD